MGLCGVKADWHLNTDAPALGHGRLIITDPPEQCPGEFTTFTLAGLGVGSGRYSGDGGEYGGGATGPGEAGMLTHRIGVIPPGAIITFTGLIGDLLFGALLGLLGVLLVLLFTKDTDLALRSDGLGDVGVWLRVLRLGDLRRRLGSGIVHGLAGL